MTRSRKYAIRSQYSSEVTLPAKPTPGYLVFLGRRGRFEQRLGRDDLVLENYVRDSAPWLRMVLTAR